MGLKRLSKFQRTFQNGDNSILADSMLNNFGEVFFYSFLILISFRTSLSLGNNRVFMKLRMLQFVILKYVPGFESSHLDGL